MQIINKANVELDLYCTPQIINKLRNRQNNFMKSKGQNQRITKIISISQNYKIHRHNLDTIKPSIDSASKKRQLHIDKMATQRLKYRQAARDFSIGLLDRENSRIVNRIAQIAQEDRTRRYSQFSIFKDTQNRELKSSRSSKRLASASSTHSLTSVCSNIRRRTIRQKQIEQQNKRIAKRISNPKKLRTLALSELNKSYERQQQIVKTRSRFSEKNQQIVRSLALQGLKFDKKNIQFLPQLSSKRKALNNSISQQKIK